MPVASRPKPSDPERGAERIRTAARCLGAFNTSGWVYFAQPYPGGPIKVGWSSHPSERLRLLNLKLREPVLSLVAMFPAERQDERDLHRHWKRHRLLGEWFRPASEILAAIELCRLLHDGPGADGIRLTLVEPVTREAAA